MPCADPADRPCPFLDYVIPANELEASAGALHCTGWGWGTTGRCSPPRLTAHHSHPSLSSLVLTLQPQPYDMLGVVQQVVDEGQVLETMRDYAKNIITGRSAARETPSFETHHCAAEQRPTAFAHTHTRH